MRIMKAAIRIAAVGTALLAGAPRLLAQGCSMCYTEAAAQGPRAARQLNLAILTLLVPSVLMFAGVLVAAFRRREHDLATGEEVDVSGLLPPRKSVPDLRPHLAPDASANHT
jgi:hypothetical protein